MSEKQRAWNDQVKTTSLDLYRLEIHHAISGALICHVFPGALHFCSLPAFVVLACGELFTHLFLKMRWCFFFLFFVLFSLRVCWIVFIVALWFLWAKMLLLSRWGSLQIVFLLFVLVCSLAVLLLASGFCARSSQWRWLRALLWFAGGVTHTRGGSVNRTC